MSENGVVITNYNKNGKNGQPLKPYTDKDGYLAVKLYKDRKCFNKRVNRLVAEVFIENPEGKTHVNHIDFDRTNNNVDNLEWCSPKENVQHSSKEGRYVGHSQKKVKCTKPDGSQIIFESISSAGRALKIAAANIQRCCNGKRHTAGGCHFEYEN